MKAVHQPDNQELAAFHLKADRRSGLEDRRDRWRGGRRDTDWYNFTANRRAAQETVPSASSVEPEGQPQPRGLSATA